MNKPQQAHGAGQAGQRLQTNWQKKKGERVSAPSGRQRPAGNCCFTARSSEAVTFCEPPLGCKYEGPLMIAAAAASRHDFGDNARDDLG